MNFRRVVASASGAVFLFLGMSLTASAFETRTADTVTIEESESIQGSIFAAGNIVVISGEVDGDVFCAGRNIKIDGIVHGDVICAGEHVDIDAQVDGNVRAAGSTVKIAGNVVRNVTLAGQSILLADTTVVYGEVIGLGESIAVAGTVKGNVLTRAKHATITAVIGGSLDANGERLTIDESAQVQGETKYVGGQPAQVASGASLSAGIVESQKPAQTKTKMRKNWTPGNAVGRAIVGMIMTVVTGWILLKVLPAATKRSTDLVLDTPVRSGLWGVGFLILGPLLMVVLLITIIGIPLALSLFLAWLFVLMLSAIPVTFAVGQKLMNATNSKSGNKIQELLVGAVVLAVASVIPVVGGFVSLFTGLVGTGAILRSIKTRGQK